MKILLAHNFYGSSAPSGENSVFSAETDLLLKAGNKVVTLTRQSDEIRKQWALGMLKGALSTPWNPFSYLKAKVIIQRECPAVMHVHNTFPLLSNSIFYSAMKTSTATVLTLHNYRTVCAAAIPMRNGKTCTKCIDLQSVFPAIKYGCYRQSRFASLPLVLSIALHRTLGTWQKHIDAFIVLTDFQRCMMISAGFPAERIYVKPHFYPSTPTPIACEDRDAKVLFVGRLGEEKGVGHLIKAWQQWGTNSPQLELIGDGPLRPELERLAKGQGDRVRFLGQLPFKETQCRLAKAKLLVLPSICFEGFPMVIREAFALGVPVAASNLGAMASLVEDGENGVLFEPGSVNGIFQAISDLWNEQPELEGMAKAARAEFEEKYRGESNYKILMDIYEKAIDNRRRKFN